MKVIYLLILSATFRQDIDDLAAPDFQTREQAERKLSQWVDVVYPLLDPSCSDPEQRRRILRVREGMYGPLPPIAVLSGFPVPEWVSPLDGGGIHRVWGDATLRADCKGKVWYPEYILPDKCALAYPLIRYYGEKARTQYEWMQWHHDNDGREATRLWTQDMMKVGISPYLIRKVIDYMRERERNLKYWKPRSLSYS